MKLFNAIAALGRLCTLLLPGFLGLSGLLGANQALAQSFDYGLSPLAIGRDTYLLEGAREDFNTRNGGNIVNTAFIVTSDGVVVIDSGPSLRYGEQMRAAIARITAAPILRVFNTHAHPDHFLGNQAFAGSPIYASRDTQEHIRRDGNGFAENLYRMSGDWMKGTEVQLPNHQAQAGVFQAGDHRIEVILLQGHTGSDMVIFDRSSGVLFTGDLVFHQRAPTTPHATIAQWLTALDQLQALTRDGDFRRLVPGHGPATPDDGPIRQTRAYLQWLQHTIRQGAESGEDMNEVMAHPLPPEFRTLGVANTEFRRSVGHLFPAAEQAALKKR